MCKKGIRELQKLCQTPSCTEDQPPAGARRASVELHCPNAAQGMQGRGTAARGKSGSAAGKGSEPSGRAAAPPASPVGKQPGPRCGPSTPPPTPGLSRGKKEPHGRPCGRQANPGTPPPLPPSLSGRAMGAARYHDGERLRVQGRQPPVSSPAAQLHGSRHLVRRAARRCSPRLAAPERPRAGLGAGAARREAGRGRRPQGPGRGASCSGEPRSESGGGTESSASDKDCEVIATNLWPNTVSTRPWHQARLP